MKIILNNTSPAVIGVDIGGTLAKIICITPYLKSSAQDYPNGSFRLQFRQVDCICVPRYFDVRSPKLITSFLTQFVVRGTTLNITGGGAHRLSAYLESALGVKIVKHDEMLALTLGLEFMLRCSERESLIFDLRTRKSIPIRNPINDQSPFLLVNIGSGVSILKVDGPGRFTRVSGTCIGGGTALGLSKICAAASSFEDLVKLSSIGSDSLDLQVQDLVGDTAGSKKLPHDALASSFGRIYTEGVPAVKEDIARSSIRMISYNIGYLAVLLARIHEVQRIFFSGKYINKHSFTMQTITQAVVFYSQYDLRSCKRRQCFDDCVAELQFSPGTHQALFLEHDGYLGAAGAMQSFR